jgi:tRNA pseudouridine55 synthase
MARYFLGSSKSYEATLRFGETTAPGDPTAEISERSDHLPGSLAELQQAADRFSAEPYLQTPPMFSAKKKDGKPLYELAREGIEIEREPKLCQLTDFRFESYESPRARFSVTCSSGTYIRTLAQDFARRLGTVGMLDTLHRTRSGSFDISDAMSADQISDAILAGTSWDALPCFIPFDQLLEGYARADATDDEATAILQGRQNVLFSILKRVKEPATSSTASQAGDTVVIFSSGHLLAVARQEVGVWGLERVFPALR